jgi:hypothetical protein
MIQALVFNMHKLIQTLTERSWSRLAFFFISSLYTRSSGSLISEFLSEREGQNSISLYAVRRPLLT